MGKYKALPNKVGRAFLSILNYSQREKLIKIKDKFV
jgi:hypothetical protein